LAGGAGYKPANAFEKKGYANGRKSFLGACHLFCASYRGGVLYHFWFTNDNQKVKEKV
jgi:hypothetical protein